MSKVQEKIYRCPLELSIDLIGGKWKSVILWHLRKDILRFSQLKRRLPGITQKMLTQQLRELEADGMINREVYPQVPPKVEYSLTELGKTVLPMLRSLYKWGIKYSDIYEVEVDTSLTETTIKNAVKK
ncbi:winged helix-turn-helix transcriptional regulator [Wukongibacter sp. M2B1]|uniref:winged helix-turn-helix transcriptional regulator n=1 Tax=Wukongibacter sp. M2B1 TaxID=3088895 RepID=UPI003D7AC4E8